MTFDQALAELGIDREAGPEEARRAYLRLLKTRRPETDPQGFMRLREAFDLVKGRLDAQESFRAAMAARAAAAEPTPEPPVAPEPPVEAHDAAPDPVLPPDDASAPEPAVSEETAPEATEQEEDEEAEEPPSEAEVDRRLAAGDRAGAADELARLFDAAAKDIVRLPPFPKAMGLILELHEHAELGPAKGLEESVVAWLHASGQEVRMLRGNAAIAWAMTRELGALRGKFPKKARAALARGVRTGDFGRTQLALAKLRDNRPSVAEEAAGRLRVSAPVLAQQFANILDPPAPPQHGGVGLRRTSWGYWGVAVVVLNLLRFLVGGSSSTPAPAYPDPVSVAAIRKAERQKTVANRADLISVELRRLALYDSSPASTYAQMTANVQAVADGVRWDHCGAAWEAMRSLQRLGKVTDGPTQGEIDALERSLRDSCGDPAPELTARPVADTSAPADAGPPDAGPKPPKGKGTPKKP